MLVQRRDEVTGSRRLLLAGAIAGLLGCGAAASAQMPSDALAGTNSDNSGVQSDGARDVAARISPQSDNEGVASPDADDGSQQEVIRLEEIVVTARKRPELVHDVPMSVSVMTGDRLQRDGDHDLRDIGGLFAGVSFNDSNNQGGEFSIRGLTSTGSGSDTSIGMYIDGVYVGSESAISQRLFDLSNIQVLRGPQGTLFGRDTVAGAINIETRKPEPHLGGSVNAVLGNYGLRQAGGVLNVPLAGDKLMARLNFVDRKRDGYLENTAQPGTWGNDEDGRSTRLHLMANPTDTLDLLFSVDKSWDSTCDNMFKIVGGSLYDGNTDPDVSAWDGPCRDDSRIGGYSFQLNQQLGDLTLTSITAYRYRKQDFLTDRDFTALPVLATGLELNDRHFTQEFRLSSAGNERFNWVAGAFLFNRHSHQDTILNLGPGFLGPGNENLVNAVADGKTRSYAAFASGEYRLTDRFKMDLGLRYTSESKSVDYEQTATLPIPGFGVVEPFHKTLSGSEWSPTLTMTWATSDNANIYSRIARGHKAGGFNAGPSSDPDQVEFQPETLSSYELGFKSRLLDGRLQLDGDVYYLDYRDIQLSQQDGAGFFISNAASAHSYGAEAQLGFRMRQYAIINASLGYVNAKYDQYGDKSGNVLPRAPKWTGAVNLDLSWNVGSSGSLFVIPEVAYRSANFVDSANTVLFRQRGHADVNLRAGYESYDGWSLALWTRNATDQRYVLGGFAVDPVVYATTTSPPRTWGIDFQWMFE